MSADPLAELRPRFCERALRDANALEVALSASDPDQIEVLTHGLAGAAGLFGFTAIGVMAKSIDGRFADGEPPTSAQVEALIALIRRDLAAYS